MTAIADMATYLSRIANPDRSVTTLKNNRAGNSAERGLCSWWQVAPDAGGNPVASFAQTGASGGAMGLTAPGGQLWDSGIGQLWLCQAESIMNDGTQVMWILDRLVHSGGMSGIVTGAQSTNLPTAALTRYTTGAGVFAAIEIFTSVGSTATTVTASYTNQAGTTGRTTQPRVIGGSGDNLQGRMLILPLQQGDTGVRAVANINLVATTGGAGALGITLFKPLLCVQTRIGSQYPNKRDWIRNGGGIIPEVLDGACLQMAYFNTSGSSSTGVVTLKLDMIDI